MLSPPSGFFYHPTGGWLPLPCPHTGKKNTQGSAFTRPPEGFRKRLQSKSLTKTLRGLALPCVAIPFFDYPLVVAIFILSHSPKLSSKKREKEGEVFFSGEFHRNFWGVPQKWKEGGFYTTKRQSVAKWRSGEVANSHNFKLCPIITGKELLGGQKA